MKKLLLLTTILLGLSGCGADSATSKTDSTKQIESSSSQSSSIKSTASTTTTKQSTEATTAQTKTSASEGKVSEADFKELLSGVEYNKDYLTEDQVAELKEMHKADLTEKQYQELLKVLGE
ncbi:hypothetical protein P7E02_19465 [Enterococcus hulanensis]|uniref:hypothetical protein n=1 Tax=Enterococcus hulanensis TaxID=2559929 RepID=UPI00288EB462|nr:hypothetical protein [Enterococcus hulanensis]MDT2662068.1 hypothetical protein [Enterococcus hulanensis]